MLVWATGACGILGPDIDDVGVVRFVDVEGGCWIIETDERRLEPINMDSVFRVDGLRIEFEADERRDLVSVCQVGSLVELVEIRAVLD